MLELGHSRLSNHLAFFTTSVTYMERRVRGTKMEQCCNDVMYMKFLSFF